MTFEKAFESIKKKFDNTSTTGVEDFALQVTLSDEDCGGTFYIAVQNGVLDVAPYDYRDNDAILDITKADFLALAAGRKSLEKVVEAGASLKGNTAVIDAVKAVLKTAKAAAKETTAEAAPKKAAPKKTAKAAPAKAEPAKAEKTVKTAKAAKTAKTTKTAAAKKSTAKKTSK